MSAAQAPHPSGGGLFRSVLKCVAFPRPPGTGVTLDLTEVLWLGEAWGLPQWQQERHFGGELHPFHTV